MDNRFAPPPYNRKAFTLSEVLITLVIIGIISAITVPTLFANHKWQEYKSALKKAHSTLNNAVNAYYLENGTFPQRIVISTVFLIDE